MKLVFPSKPACYYAIVLAYSLLVTTHHPSTIIGECDSPVTYTKTLRRHADNLATDRDREE